MSMLRISPVRPSRLSGGRLSVLGLPPAASHSTAVTTSAEEREAFHIVRSIVGRWSPTRRVVMCDAQTYCAGLLDDNNRRPICRLRFNDAQKLRLGLFNEAREEEQVAIESVDDIYSHAGQLRRTVEAYLPKAE